MNFMLTIKFASIVMQSKIHLYECHTRFFNIANVQVSLNKSIILKYKKELIY